MTSYIEKMTIPSRLETVHKWLESGQIKKFLDLHRQIVDVIEKNDASRVKQAVEEHYVLWKE
jgi:DNA-binding FadR family transcriptional regulator